MKKLRYHCRISNLLVSEQCLSESECKSASVAARIHITEVHTSERKARSGLARYSQASKDLIARRLTTIRMGAALILVALVASIIYSSPTSPSERVNCAPGSIAIGGSTALLPLVSTITHTYHETCPQTAISINKNISSSKAGLGMLRTGNIQIGASDLISSNPSLIGHPVAVIIYVMIVNPDVAQVGNLSTSQIQNIYNSTFTNWSQVNGNPQPIFVVNRTSASGTRATFQKYILAGKTTLFPASKVDHYDEEDTSEQVARKVASTPGAIGYVNLRDALLATNVKIITIDGVQATSDNVKRNAYPFWSVSHIYTRTSADKPINAFVKYMAGNDARSLMSNRGYIPLKDMSPAMLSLHSGPIASDGV